MKSLLGAKCGKRVCNSRCEITEEYAVGVTVFAQNTCFPALNS